MKSFVALLIAALAFTARAQIPSLGFCPEYLPMTGFDMDRFAGIWYEAERYFQLTEVASRCVMSNYTKGPDGKFHVVNEVTSRFTGIKRVLEGEIRKAPSKAEEGKLHVKYTTVPLIPLETQYNVLETDYDNYAVLWSCSGVGPVHTQNAWIMTRQRLAPGEILQKAYGVLDKYKISKVFFVKTNQDDCAYLDSLQAEQASKPTEPPKKAETQDEAQEQPQPIAGKSTSPLRSPIVPDAPEAIIETRNAEIDAKIAEELNAILQAVKPLDGDRLKANDDVPWVPDNYAYQRLTEGIIKIALYAQEKKKKLVRQPAFEQVELVKKEPATIPEAPVVADASKETAPVVQEDEKILLTEPKKSTEVVEEKIEIVNA